MTCLYQQLSSIPPTTLSACHTQRLLPEQVLGDKALHEKASPTMWCDRLAPFTCGPCYPCQGLSQTAARHVTGTPCKQNVLEEPKPSSSAHVLKPVCSLTRRIYGFTPVHGHGGAAQQCWLGDVSTRSCATSMRTSTMCHRASDLHPHPPDTPQVQLHNGQQPVLKPARHSILPSKRPDTKPPPAAAAQAAAPAACPLAQQSPAAACNSPTPVPRVQTGLSAAHAPEHQAATASLSYRCQT